jgi:hypothetical protein
MISRTNEFTILPSTSSMMGEAIIVLILFILLNIYIVYLSAYDSGYKPNFVMLLNFIFGDSISLKKFKTYIKDVAFDKLAMAVDRIKERNNIKRKEAFSNNDDILSNFIFSIKKSITKLFVKDNKIYSVQTI